MMETLLRNMLLIFGLFFVIDFISEYPEIFKKADQTVDIVKETIGGQGE
jgi:hypothetical protein|tara:strand:+ start:906 stop:1052 length:147 start_codon:yes stop_codon:yes gene_type:complete